MKYRKYIIIPIIILAFIASWCSQQPQSRQALPTATAPIYYVSVTGSDSNPGTQAQPWKTIQKAANTMIAGDTVKVMAGSYNERVYVDTNSGKSGSPITFQAQGAAIVKGFVIRANYITIKDLEIANGDRLNGGIYIKGAYNIIENNYVHHAASRGIEFYTYPKDINVLLTVHDNIVRNNRLYYNGALGILVSGRNNLIENNEIWGTQQCLPINGSCLDADGIHFFGQGHIIRGNYIHDILYGPVGINPSIGDYVDKAHIDCFQTIENQYFEKASDILFEGNYCDNLQFQNDYEKGQGWMMESASNITIRNNVVRAYRGINTKGYSQANNLYVYNNTFINDLALSGSDPADLPYQPNVIEIWDLKNTILKNNIFYDQKGILGYLTGDTSPLLFDYNLIYNSDGSLPVRMPSQLHELRGVNPKFVNPSAKDYHLQPGSPACTGGENGTYIGAYPCGTTATNTPQAATGTPTLTATATKTQTYTPTPTKTPTAPKTRTPTPSFTPTFTQTPVPPTFTATFTPIPPTVTMTPTVVTPTVTPIPLDCVKITWYKATGLNIRESASMHNLGKIGYLYKDFVFRPLSIKTTDEGMFAQYGQPGWIAMDLTQDNNTYAILGACR